MDEYSKKKKKKKGEIKKVETKNLGTRTNVLTVPNPTIDQTATVWCEKEKSFSYPLWLMTKHITLYNFFCNFLSELHYS